MLRRERPFAPLLLGAAMLVGVLVASYAKGLGVPINISVTAMTLALVCVPLLDPATVVRIRVTGSDGALLAFVATALVSFALSADRMSMVPPSYLAHTVALVMMCPLAYALGRIFAALATGDQVHRLFVAALLLSLAFAAVRVAIPEFVTAGQDEKGSYYQYAGDCLAVVALLALCAGGRRPIALHLALTLLLLALLGSRASVGAFAVGVLFSRYGAAFLVAGGAAVLLLLTNLGGVADAVPALGEISRIGATLSTVMSGGEDTSLGDRQGFMALALETVTRSPFSGLYAYDYSGNGYAGGFAHNVMDVWAQYGLVPFVMLATAVFATPGTTVLRSWTAPGDAHSVAPAVVPLLAFVAGQLVFFRHPESIVLFFALGSVVSFASVRGREPA